MFSTRASSSSRSSGTSRTVTGTVSSPACCAARQRRSPAMIWYLSPRRRTRMGWTMPLSRRESASSWRRPASTPIRGWCGFGSRLAVGSSIPAPPEGAGSGSGRSAESPLPSAFLFMGHHFLGEVQVGLGPLRPYVIEDYGFTEAGRLPEADAAGHRGLEDLVLEVPPDVGHDLLGQ